MAHFIIYQKCPFNGQLSLAGYAQSSVPGELSKVFTKILKPKPKRLVQVHPIER